MCVAGVWGVGGGGVRVRAGMCACVCAHRSFLTALVLCFVMGCVLQFGELAHKRVHYYYYNAVHSNILMWSWCCC